ncbi:MAG: energy-coupling factor transporter transmembrane protein EcfT, partial [Coriobacteriales bacterium]|nr:energy-coupling factor transporter transmembrane protein EcfT [Coriobacteriales bacterium]
TLLFVIAIAIFLADNFVGLLTILVFLLIVIALSSLTLRLTAKAFAPLSILLIFPLILNLFFMSDGNQLVRWGIILITDGGLYRAGFMTLRLLLLFTTAVLLTLTTSLIALGDAVASMLRPFERFGMPSYEIAMMITIALRFIPTLLEDFDHIRKAQQARGAVFDRGGPIARAKAFLPCLIPLFAQSFRRAEELALAMESRCYHGGSERTHYHILKLGMRDACATACCCALLLTMIFWL